MYSFNSVCRHHRASLPTKRATSEGERDRKRERERPIIPFPRALVGIALSIAPLFPFAFFLQQNPSRRKGESAAPRLDGRETDEWRRPGHERGWVAVSFEAATKGSGNYGEAANSREAEAKAAVGSQADLRRGFAPTFIRAARPFCAASSVDARRRRPEFPPADPIQSHVALVPLSLSLSPSLFSLCLYLLSQPPSTTDQLALRYLCSASIALLRSPLASSSVSKNRAINEIRFP